MTLALMAPGIGSLIAQEGPRVPTPPPVQVPPHLDAVVSSFEPLTNLTFDAEIHDYHAKPGEATAQFTFMLTNVSDTPVHIIDVVPGCACTKATIPREPWVIAPHTTEELHATMNLAGKPPGANVKTLTISSTNGMKVLSVRAIVPLPAQMTGDRTKNQELAKADRQAVFKNDCVQCHVTPTLDKQGKELYDAACGICHDSQHRASMVKDLGSLGYPVNAEFWTTITANGKPGTMMPAFAQDQGGPLTKEQITSLVHYLTTDFPRTHQPTPQVELPAISSPPPVPAPQPVARPVRQPPPRVPPVTRPGTP